MSDQLSRRGLLAGVALSAIGLSACSPSSDTAGSADSNRIALVAATTSTVVPDGTPAQTSIAVSRALVQSSPAVVVAASTQATAAASQAVQLGLPLLLIEPPPTGDGAAPVSSSAQPAAGVIAEIERLKARTVLTVGSIAQQAAKQFKDLTVTSEPGDVPSATRPTAPKDLVVLITTPVPAATAKDADPVAIAASTTARALGLSVLTAPGGDPRAGADIVAAIAKSKPTRAVAVGSAFGSTDVLAERLATAATGVQLPGGGQTFAPDKLYVALYGYPGAPVLGLLGEQDLDKSVVRARKMAEPYRKLTSETVIPAFEIITTVAIGSPAPDNSYSRQADPELVRPWIERAQAEGLYVILDLQPGRANMLDQAKNYQTLLKYPNVGLAVDPEWKLLPNQLPMKQIGQANVAEINSVADWLATFTRENKLPQKAFVVHQFQTRMIVGRENLHTDHDELSVIIHVDGSGAPGDKYTTYRQITTRPPANVSWGWKNFIDEDHPMLSPQQTMQVSPHPTMISYQ